MTNIPKRELIKLISTHIPEGAIRLHFNIGSKTDTVSRLGSFSKEKLVEFIKLNDSVYSRLEFLTKEFPFSGSPSLYILTYEALDDVYGIASNTNRLEFIENSIVSEVIIPGDFLEYERSIELQVFYKKRIEYTESNDLDKTYGATKFVHSLERGIIWFFEKYAVLATADFVSTRPIRIAISALTTVKLNVPVFDEEMLRKLQANSKISNASFSKSGNGMSDELDVKSITIYDDSLRDSTLFEQLDSSNARQQNSSFLKQNDYTTKGVGISRRYAKVWTPAKLKKLEIFGIAKKVMSKLAFEVDSLDLTDENEALSHFLIFNVKELNNKILNTHESSVISQLLSKIIVANSREHKSVEVSNQMINDLVKISSKIGLMTSIDYDCENCGTGLYSCPECGNTRVNIVDGGYRCTNCKISVDFEDMECDCGKPLEIMNYENHIVLIPDYDLVTTLQSIVNNSTSENISGFTFLVDRKCLKVIYSEQSRWMQYSLRDLKKWRVQAHYPLDISRTKVDKKMMKAIRNTREKCHRTGYHPTKNDCSECLSKNLSKEELQNGELCLLRVFGIPISEGFDGIHHGYEKADVVYTDRDIHSDEEISIGIHMKSRRKVVKGPIGRGHEYIKGLMCQYIYSLYLNRIQKYNFDIIGISIPEILDEDVRSTFIVTSKLYGISIILIEEGDWCQIFKEASNVLEF